ncbi:MAG: hypothetical protein KTR13_04865 [Saprospiraceae bacterium]|nr:hypothetical protein [Saprospiraceae bacterium]
MNNTRLLIISGMHRSGTSLLAGWLQRCGLDVGDQLLPGNFSNARGHFEDEDIMRFQQDLMLRKGIHVFPKSAEVPVDESDESELQALLASKYVAKSVAGFKDPRTCLFLNQLWANVLPDAYSIFIFRHPKQVIASLEKREEYMMHRSGLLKTLKWNAMRFKWLKRFEKAYVFYNKQLLEYASARPERSVILELAELEAQAPLGLNILNRWGFDLNAVPIQEVKDDSLFTSTALKPLTIPLQQQTIDVYNQLKELSKRSLEQ